MILSEFQDIFEQYYTPIKNFLYYKCAELDRAGTWDFDKNNLSESIQSITRTMGFSFEIAGDPIFIKQR